jgi:putative Holliday junction resolvase
MAKILALDLGTTTVGVAISNEEETLVFPREVIRFKKDNYYSARMQVLDLVNKENIAKIVLGYPLNADGREGNRVESVLRFKKDLETANPNLVIELEDERYSTLEARDRLYEAGLNHQKVNDRVDSVAAEIILERYLKNKEHKL